MMSRTQRLGEPEREETPEELLLYPKLENVLIWPETSVERLAEWIQDVECISSSHAPLRRIKDKSFFFHESSHGALIELSHSHDCRVWFDTVFAWFRKKTMEADPESVRNYCIQFVYNADLHNGDVGNARSFFHKVLVLNCMLCVDLQLSALIESKNDPTLVPLQRIIFDTVFDAMPEPVQALYQDKHGQQQREVVAFKEWIRELYSHSPWHDRPSLFKADFHGYFREKSSSGLPTTTTTTVSSYPEMMTVLMWPWEIQPVAEWIREVKTISETHAKLPIVKDMSFFFEASSYDRLTGLVKSTDCVKWFEFVCEWYRTRTGEVRPNQVRDQCTNLIHQSQLRQERPSAEEFLQDVSFMCHAIGQDPEIGWLVQAEKANPDFADLQAIIFDAVLDAMPEPVQRHWERRLASFSPVHRASEEQLGPFKDWIYRLIENNPWDRLDTFRQSFHNFFHPEETTQKKKPRTLETSQTSQTASPSSVDTDYPLALTMLRDIGEPVPALMEGDRLDDFQCWIEIEGRVRFRAMFASMNSSHHIMGKRAFNAVLASRQVSFQVRNVPQTFRGMRGSLFHTSQLVSFHCNMLFPNGRSTQCELVFHLVDDFEGLWVPPLLACSFSKILRENGMGMGVFLRG